MNSPHKLARTAIINALSNGTYGWNAIFADIAATYTSPVAAFLLNFTSTSGNVFLGQLAGFEDVTLSQLDQHQACAVYTTMAANQKQEMPRSFSGPVMGHVDWSLTYREKEGTATGIEANDTESPADAIDEAMGQIFCVSLGSLIALPSGVRWTKNYASERTPLILNEDGFSQIIRYELLFEVHI
ncbi:MAG: hypothetical protein ABFD89_09045 [Bryobacteraceae bacterium]